MTEAVDTIDAGRIDLPPVATVDEVARYMRVDRKTVYYAVNRGELPCFRIGRLIRFRGEAVVKLLEG